MPFPTIRHWAKYPQNCPKTARRIARRQQQRARASSVSLLAQNPTPTPTTIVMGSVAGPLSASLRGLRDYVLKGVRRGRERFTSQLRVPGLPWREAGVERWDEDVEDRVRGLRDVEKVYEEFKRGVGVGAWGEGGESRICEQAPAGDRDRVVVYQRMAALEKEAEALMQTFLIDFLTDCDDDCDGLDIYFPSSPSSPATSTASATLW